MLGCDLCYRKGWTDDELGMEWKRHIYEPYNQKLVSPGEERLHILCEPGVIRNQRLSDCVDGGVLNKPLTTFQSVQVDQRSIGVQKIEGNILHREY